MAEKQKYEEVYELEEVSEEEVVPTEFEDTQVENKHQKDTSHQMEICNDV